MSGYSVTLHKDKAFQRAMRRAGARMGDLTVPFKEGGAHMLASVAENFRREGRPEKWAPLAPETLAEKQKRKHDKILVRSGGLKSSVTFKALRDALQIGTNKVYGRIQQLGRGRLGRGPRVGRPYLMFQEEDVELVKDALMNYVLGG